MFNLINLFGKKKEKEQEEVHKVSINYFIGNDDVPMIDIILQDYSDDTIKALCKLLDVLSKDGCYLNTIQMIQEGFLSDEQDDALIKILTHIATKQENILLNTEQSDEYIKPSDVAT
jgi:hypothetical protein